MEGDELLYKNSFGNLGGKRARQKTFLGHVPIPNSLKIQNVDSYTSKIKPQVVDTLFKLKKLNDTSILVINFAKFPSSLRL